MERTSPIDYRFLEMNPAFEKQTGIQDAKGRLMRQIAPDHEQHWFDIYSRIALTGETIRFENPAAALQTPLRGMRVPRRRSRAASCRHDFQ